MSKRSEAKLPRTGQKQANRTRKQVSPGWGERGRGKRGGHDKDYPCQEIKIMQADLCRYEQKGSVLIRYMAKGVARAAPVESIFRQERHGREWPDRKLRTHSEHDQILHRTHARRGRRAKNPRMRQHHSCHLSGRKKTVIHAPKPVELH